MEILGKITIFVKESKSEKKFKYFETGFNSKDKDGNYTDPVTLRVIFSQEILPEERQSAFKVGYSYPITINEGFLTTRGYDNREGKRISEVAIFIKKCSCDWAKAKEFKKNEKPKEATPVQEALVGPDGEPLPF